MANVAFDRVSKVFDAQEGGGQVHAIANATLQVAEAEFVSLIGPSGCGKSTLLNIAAGFDAPTTGACLVGGKPVTRPGPDRGMIFQEYALFPWMSVRDNVAFGLKMRGVGSQERSERASRLLRQLGLEGFEGRFPKDLSGGMKQRVAIARLLALDPAVMLMDEPFGALDALTRSAMQRELLQIWDQFRKTILFVTHSVEEAVFLSDRVAVMSSRPSVIKALFTVELPRPRVPTSPEFNEYRLAVTQQVESGLQEVGR